MATIPKFVSHDEAVKAKHFSRRYLTSASHTEAREKYLDLRRAKKDAAAARGAVIRTPQEQLQRLDERLGVGKGAAHERARLTKMIAARVRGNNVP